MNKTQLIGYLKTQLERLETEHNFEFSKTVLVDVLKSTFGPFNNYANAIEKVSAVFEDSYDDLYPKTVINETESSEQLKMVLQQVIEQIEVLEPEKINSKKSNKSAEIVFSAVTKHLSKNEIERFYKKISKSKKVDDLKELLLELPTDKRLDLLAEILIHKDFWEKVK